MDDFIPEGSTPLTTVTVVHYLDSDGHEQVTAHLDGHGGEMSNINVVGMLFSAAIGSYLSAREEGEL